MRLLIDMNLSPEWTQIFASEGWESVHWSTVGHPAAPDFELMEWAKVNGFSVFTHDLDFGALLAATGAAAPSVVQLRCEDTRPAIMAAIVVASVKAQRAAIDLGALLTIDPRRMRVTVLPLKRK